MLRKILNEVFFQLEHYVASVAEPTMHAQLYDALLEMLSARRQFDAVTQDPRWASQHGLAPPTLEVGVNLLHVLTLSRTSFYCVYKFM